MQPIVEFALSSLMKIPSYRPLIVFHPIVDAFCYQHVPLHRSLTASEQGSKGNLYSKGAKNASRSRERERGGGGGVREREERKR